ncbi:hypothetical protein ZWY2020_022949 [Hordeum vulgare]|nr:hypothetical protein ZWY2020_022949 [Hordeum vulgare]
MNHGRAPPHYLLNLVTGFSRRPPSALSTLPHRAPMASSSSSTSPPRPFASSTHSCASPSPKVINGAAFDDSTSPPTLIIFAKPGDEHWTLVSPGQISYPVYNSHRKVLFYTLLSLGGRCYVSSPEGSVYLFELQPLPRLVEVVDQRRFAEKDYIWRNHIISLLVRGTGGWMLMVRCWRGVEHFAGFESYNPSEIFTLAHGMTFRIEVLEVDIAGNRLVPVTSLGRHALFLGLTHCLHISTETFPSISADSIYLGHLHQQTNGFGIYHINNINGKANFRKTEAKHKFITNIVTGDFTPDVRPPYNLDEHLVNYVDRSHKSSKPCMNHTSC